MPATVTAKGQITIPKEVRDLLDIKPGTKVDFRRGENGEIILFKAGPKTESRFAKLLGSAGPGMSTDEIMALTRGDD